MGMRVLPLLVLITLSSFAQNLALAQPKVEEVWQLNTGPLSYARIFGMNNGYYAYLYQLADKKGMRLALLDSNSKELSLINTGVDLDRDLDSWLREVEMLKAVSGNKLYLLIHDGRFHKANLFVADADLAKISPLDFDNKNRLQPIKIFAHQNHVLVYGENRVEGPVLMKIDITDGSVLSMPLGREKKWQLELDQIVFSETADHVALLRFKSKRQSIFWLQKLNRQLEFEGDRIRINEKEPLAEARVVQLSDGWLVSGITSDDRNRTVNGCFSARISSAWEKGALQMIPLQQLQNFFNYLDPAQQERLLNKVEQLNRHKRALEINTRFYLHEARFIHQSVILTAEFYTPTYITHTTAGPGGFTTFQEFDGFQYSHAAYLIFDTSGNLVRDLCMPFRLPYKPFEVNQRSHWYFAQGNIYGYYLNGSRLSWMAMNADDPYGAMRSEQLIQSGSINGLQPVYLDLVRTKDAGIQGCLIYRSRNNGLTWQRTPEFKSYFLKINEQ